MMNRVVIGVGSNIDPEKNIAKAKEILTSEQKFIKSSQIIKTKPIGKKNQPDFLNCAFLIDTDLSREEFNRYLKGIEKKLNRFKTKDKFGPRTIDLDIVVWNGEVVDEDFYKRDFLRSSVQELLPDLQIGIK